MTGLVLMAVMAGLATVPPNPKGMTVLEPFNYHGVTLDDGALKRQFDETRAFYLSIPNDDLLKGFRARAGLPAPGVDLGGWYTGDVFHVFGQILSGLARMYAATGDPAVKAKADALLEGWGKCIAPDGYFYYSKSPNAPHYIYDKTVCGLVDMYLCAGNKDSLKYLSTITDWAIKNLSRVRGYNNQNQPDGNTEWYTLSENLYRAYLATGDEKYRDFGKVWEYTEYWDVYASKGDIVKKSPGYHAYSHVNNLSGAGAAYRVTGDKHYLDVIVNAYDYLQGNQCFATGGYGSNETLLDPARLPATLRDWTNSFETQCSCWAGFKLSKYLMSFTGDARYGDWVEKLIIDGIGAGIPTTADGKAFYYANYNLHGAAKQPHWDAYSCCVGTATQAIADYHDLIYFKDKGDLYVNLYTPSTVQWDGVTLHQHTRFPESDTTELTVSTSKEREFGLKLRAPAWLAGPMEVRVNGRAVKADPDAHRWVTVKRRWKDGDKVDVRLPMNFWACPLPHGKTYPTAIMYGPVTMAFRTAAGNPGRKVDLANLQESFVPSPGEPLNFHLKSDPAILVRPFYQYKEGETYFMYLDPDAENRVPHRMVTFSEGWLDGGHLRYCSTVGATAEYTFDGTGIKWLGWKFDDAGRARVEIDGKEVVIVDQFGPGRDLPFEWSHTGLARGRHTIKITLLPDKTAESKNTYLNVAGFEVIP